VRGYRFGSTEEKIEKTADLSAASVIASHFSLGLGILRLNEPEKWC
jgi:hypothetical protein